MCSIIDLVRSTFKFPQFIFTKFSLRPFFFWWRSQQPVTSFLLAKGIPVTFSQRFSFLILSSHLLHPFFLWWRSQHHHLFILAYRNTSIYGLFFFWWLSQHPCLFILAYRSTSNWFCTVCDSSATTQWKCTGCHLFGSTLRAGSPTVFSGPF